MRIHAGQRIDRRYELLEPIGEGGQGRVWKVKDLLADGTDRALKLIPLDHVDSEAFDRARREARALVRNPHPSLVACYGFFEDMESGVAGIVLEFVSGEPLADVLHSPRMTLEHRTGLLEQLAGVLAHVHKAGLVHRDLKPDNVLVTESFWATPYVTGTVKLVDFGIAVELGNPRPLTATGAIIGTVPYMAPEVLAPKIFGSTQTPATTVETGFGRDVFAFGVLGAEVLLERHPTGLSAQARAEDFVQAYREAAEGQRPWPPTNLYGTWAPAIRACLALDPSRRPRSGAEIVAIAHSPRTEPQGPRQTEPLSGHPAFERHQTSPMTFHPAPPTPRTEPGRPLVVGDNGPRISSASPLSTASNRSASLVLVGALGGAAAATILMFLMLRGGESSDEVPLSTIPPTSFSASQTDISSDAPPPAIPRASSAASVPHQAPLKDVEPLLPEHHEPPELPIPLFSAGDAPSCPQRCCGGIDCVSKRERCASGRECIPWPCDERIDPSGEWLLRVASVWEDEQDLRRRRPRSEVCLRRSKATNKDWTCTNLSDLGYDRGKGNRLPATTRDLILNGIDVKLQDVSGRAFARYDLATVDSVKVAALCKGLIIKNFYEDSTGFRYRVIVHLDPP